MLPAQLAPATQDVLRHIELLQKLHPGWDDLSTEVFRLDSLIRRRLATTKEQVDYARGLVRLVEMSTPEPPGVKTNAVRIVRLPVASRP
jgi:hypothetical protein